MRDLNDVLFSIQYHQPDEKTAAAHERLRAWAKGAMQFIDENVPPGREKSLAFTELENALMWAHKGIAIAGAKENSDDLR